MVPHLPPSRAPLVRITANNVSLVVTDELAAPTSTISIITLLNTGLPPHVIDYRCGFPVVKLHWS